MGWIIIVAVIAGMAWWFREKQIKNPPIAPVPPACADHQDEIEQKPEATLTGDEREVRRTLEAFERGAAERTKTYRAQKQAMSDAEKKIAKANDYIKSSHLDLALPYLWEEMRSWPGWLKNQGGKWKLPIPITDVAGEGTETRQPWVEWRHDGPLFRMTFEQDRSPWMGGGQEYATLTFAIDGIEVLSMGCARDIAKEWDQWRFTNVNALQVGPWMTQLMEFYSALRAIKERESTERTSNYVEGVAAKIDLGEAG